MYSRCVSLENMSKPEQWMANLIDVYTHDKAMELKEIKFNGKNVSAVVIEKYEGLNDVVTNNKLDIDCRSIKGKILLKEKTASA